ncbi:flagellar basal-body rod protein FlgG [Desulfobaculum xiamenense]|uniref:Flagellar basal-body rod protein FlgG n=1 Tax=Desulfobaculum xiamenense TaxID=995050 RepID=A0A846QE33_9BACT|nr:flagellar basal-body rod protein FlgF [Desulfobaculum xiamenense]NJB66986.1 flagellar basal-body rod protein FlgG [Desulfobaculum xiamenense]
MQDGMYTALFGALTQEHRMNIIANNLANVNTTGFKQDRTAFKDVFVRFAHDTIREPILHLRDKGLFPEPDYMSKVRIAESRIDFSQGSLKRSDNPLDIAISGEGFFKVRTDTGDYYTRNGHFTVSADGTVVNASGHQLLGEGGPITIEGNARIDISPEGQLFANGEAVDTIQVVTVSDLTGLRKVGQNNFEIHPDSGATEEAATDVVVQQGFLEAPNVEVVTEMVNMIETQRSFEAYQKAIMTSKETDSKAVNEVGKV